MHETVVVTPHVLKHATPHRSTTGCTFAPMDHVDVTATGPNGPLPTAKTGGGVAIQLPEKPRPLVLTIQVTPTGAFAKTHWPVQGQLVYHGNAQWRALSAPPEFQVPPQTLIQPAGFSVAFLSVFLSRLRNATNEARDVVKNVPDDRKLLNVEFDDWKVLPATTPFVASPSLVGGGLQFESPVSDDPGTDDLVFEIKGFAAPRVIAVSWPRALTCTFATPAAGPTFAAAQPTPFLVFFHAGHGQNMGRHLAVDAHGKPIGHGLYQNGYPFGWDVLYYGLFHYLLYKGSALNPRGRGSLGLLHQIHHAGKPCVLVIPQNKGGPRGPDDELVEFFDPDRVQEVLEEIQVRRFLEQGFPFVRPCVGRTAVGSMSQGNVLLSSLLTSQPSHSFLQNVVREIYIFDPHGDSDRQNAQPVRAACDWLGHDPDSDKRIRYYAQKQHPCHSFVVPNLPGSGDFIVDSSDGRFTGGVISPSCWFNAGVARPTDPNDWWQVAHQLIPGVLLTDALRKSGF